MGAWGALPQPQSLHAVNMCGRTCPHGGVGRAAPTPITMQYTCAGGLVPMGAWGALAQPQSLCSTHVRDDLSLWGRGARCPNPNHYAVHMCGRTCPHGGVGRAAPTPITMQYTCAAWGRGVRCPNPNHCMQYTLGIYG